MPTILLVEPDPDFAFIYATGLAHAGYSIVQATTAREALAVAAETAPILAILSLNTSDAWLFLERPQAGLPVLALTWNFTPAERARVLQHPQACYALRPTENEGLRRLVREALQGAMPVDAPPPTAT